MQTAWSCIRCEVKNAPALDVCPFCGMTQAESVRRTTERTAAAVPEIEEKPLYHLEHTAALPHPVPPEQPVPEGRQGQQARQGQQGKQRQQGQQERQGQQGRQGRQRQQVQQARQGQQRQQALQGQSGRQPQRRAAQGVPAQSSPAASSYPAYRPAVPPRSPRIIPPPPPVQPEPKKGGGGILMVLILLALVGGAIVWYAFHMESGEAIVPVEEVERFVLQFLR